MKQPFIILTLTGIFLGSSTLLATPAEKITPSGIKMVLIKGGTFKMGSLDAKMNANTVHEVKVDDFYMDIYEVTQKNYKSLIGMNPAKFLGENNPIERVRWMDAARFCNARSKKEGLKLCYDTKTWNCDFSANGYRLPTEAEWEYACRGGTKGSHFFKGGLGKLQNYAWFRENSQEKTHPVGTKQVNPYGLYDILGNVAEWCNDYYAKDYYKISPVNNPKGPATSNKRVLRGRSWSSRGKYCTSYKRSSDAPGTPDICRGYDFYGFRCVKKSGE